jgi:Mg2+-importing ATPase
MTMTMLVMVILVFLAHVMQGRPPVENLLFAVALAVGLSPELLPAILTVNLARGAEMMAKHGVLVRRLNAIENLGSMDILCTDKTGTLTEGVVKLQGAYDASGEASENVLRVGRLNARFQAGLPSVLDDALLMENDETEEAWTKVAEVPFDFSRKRVSVVLDGLRGTRLVTKGALAHVLEACVELDDGTLLDSQRLERLHSLAETWAAQGIRVLGVAEREVPRKASYDRFDERDLRFLGFLTFTDRPKDGAAQALKALAQLGVTVKMITGDSRLVAQHVAGLIGFPNVRMLTGEVLDTLQNEALWRMAEDTDIFAEVDPNQKERIILALKRSGHVVGFLGDGVNDAPAMHASDVSLSVQYAVDVARATADFVLLERSLDVIHRGIAEGRKTFANTLKYILTTTSANLGNMASMALASLVLPFLPLTAGQILLNNVLSDIPAVGIAEDSVDPEWVASPKRWNMRFIGHFMVEFGALSSVFDLMTYGTLLLGFRCSEDLFRTGWFVESLLSELVVALVVRTRRPFFQSRPGRLLLVLTGILVPTTFAIPYLPFARFMGFVPLPMPVALTIAGIAALYVLCAETLKGAVYRSFGESA